MKKLIAVIIVSAVCIGMALPSQAMMKEKAMMQRAMGMMDMDDMEIGMHGPHMMENIMSLGLDEKQQEAVRQTHFKWLKEFLRKKAEIEIAHVELKEILSSDTLDLKTAEQKIRQLETLKADLKIAHLRTHEEMKSKLTPDQRKELLSRTGHMDCQIPGCMGGAGMMGPRMKMMDCMMMHNLEDTDPREDSPAEKPEAAPSMQHIH